MRKDTQFDKIVSVLSCVYIHSPMLCDVMLTFSLPSMSTSLIIQVQTVVDVIGSLKKHVERQQSENREATASSASVKGEGNEKELNVEESSAGGEDLVQPTQ